MNESDRQEGLQEGEGGESNACTDPYVSESSQDIYTTPDVVETAVVTEEKTASAAVMDTHGLFSGKQAEGQSVYGIQPPYGNQSSFYGNPVGSYGNQNGGQVPCGNQSSPYGNPTGLYGNQNGGQAPCGNQSSPYGNPTGLYGNQNGGQAPYGNQSSPYGNPTGLYGNQNDGQVPCGNQSSTYGNPTGLYGNQNGGQAPCGNQSSPYGNPTGLYGNQNGGQAPYGNQSSPYGNPTGLYGNQNGGQAPYGNPNGSYGGQPPFGGQPPYNNPYNPYAAPQKKQNVGLIVGIVVGIILLFLVAVFGLTSKLVNLYTEKLQEESHHDNVYDFYDDDYYGGGYYDDGYYDDGYYDDGYYDDGYYDDGYDDSDYYSDFYGDEYSEEEEYNDQYYDLQNDIRSDLSYQVELEDYEYETDEENVAIVANIPIISGENVPNLDKINEEIRNEVEDVATLFEEEYESHVKESEENYFLASLVGYVTYMDEDKMSIAYQEEVYSDRDGGVYLKSINIDMSNGVILDNEDILAIDDAFSVEFRKKNDEQNGEIPYLTYMTDQQITDYFKSDDLIVYYTPKGMEIGFNYEEGWVTVTYEDYEKYLKVF